MILLRPDCLVFKTTDGENVPCSTHEVTLELMGDAAKSLDDEVVEHAAQAVLHYFKSEKGQSSVSIAEFSEALERALRNLGVDVRTSDGDAAPAGPAAPAVPAALDAASLAAPNSRVVEADLQELAGDSILGFELLFFPRLRDAVRGRLDGAPLVLRFRGLRACVKQLTGAKRWSSHCQNLSDRIVDYLRSCLATEARCDGCALVVS